MADIIDGTTLFRDAAFRVLVPTCPDGLQLPLDGADDADEAVRQWIATLEPQNERSCCFYDESLSYVCHLSYRTEAASDVTLRKTFERVCNSVRITTQCSFLPRSASDPHQKRQTSGRSTQSDHPSSAASKDTQNLGLPPVTPNPMPATHEGYSQYAQVAGVQVWEGGLMAVLSSSDPGSTADAAAVAAAAAEPRCLVLETEEGISAYWIGQVPLAFANVDMRDPLLAVTCHVTLRGSKIAEVDDKNVDTAGAGREDESEEMVTTDSLVGMQDVLAGLGGEDPSSRSTPLSIMRPEAALVLRKSYRSVLPLYSALTVKMRTLPTPIPFSQNSADDPMSDGLMSTICIEIEAGHVQPDLQFQVTNLRVSTRQSEGAYVSTNITRLLASEQDAETYFPFQLERFAQHNLVYNIITSPSVTGGQLQTQYLVPDRQVEHLRIDVDGFVTTSAYNNNKDNNDDSINIINTSEHRRGGKLTREFTSTWNTVLELRNAGASAQSRVASLRPIHDTTASNDTIEPIPRSAQTAGSGRAKKPLRSALHRDLVVSLSLIENFTSSNDKGTAQSGDQQHAGMERVDAYETVDAEVTILNVSGRTVRLVLSDTEGAVSHLEGGYASSVLADQLASVDPGAPAPPPARKPIIMLQNDLKLAPLLPRSCQSVRLRFMPLVPGSQRIPAFKLSDFERDQQVELQFEMYLQVN
ncbi:hypothetical protein QFC22_001791 [Naganishia vaughanmartiniae]|uniref:Uncharacterized protein n=1 Tax=Naganishia vaughanmartiniae TaxID=1424756 RepID=A0ACC2XG56_9TREE|nr:hypothetical protein QFC22_001791 [Naganishia vaughanmartiniae]